MTGTPFSETKAGTNAATSATKDAGGEYTQHFVTYIGGHADTDAALTVESPAGTILWESKIDVTAEGWQFGHYFGERGIPCDSNGAAVGKISHSTTDCQVTIVGYTIP